MTAKKFVGAILQDSINARNSDKETIIQAMQRCGVGLDEHQMQKIREMYSFESIRRERQKFQEKGIYLADESVRRARKLKELQMQQNMPSAAPGRAIDLINETPKAIPWMK